MTTATIGTAVQPVQRTGSDEGRPWVNVGQTERFASALGGGLLALYGLSRRSLGGLALAAFGGGLLYRGVSGHCGCYSALGVSTAGRAPATGVPVGTGMRMEAAIIVHRPAGDVYRFWRNFENLPRFMPHLRSVKMEGNRSRWTAEAPLGASVTWEAEIVNDQPGKLIAWRSLPGSQVDTAGSVHFRRAPNGVGTEVHVEMKYNPPAGRAGAAAAWLFGDDAERQIQESLRSFRGIMEAHAVPDAPGRPASGR